MMEDLTWRCDVCGEERPDAMIGVAKREGKIAISGGLQIPVQTNTKYCLDRLSCRVGAEKEADALIAQVTGEQIA